MRWTRCAELICVAAVLTGWTGPASARIVTVDDDQPADFCTIQAAIDEVNDGDTVLVQPGTYRGLGNYDLTFDEKAITVRSLAGPDVTIVDAENAGHGFYIVDNLRGTARLEGFTIRHTFHGAIKVYSSCPPRAALAQTAVAGSEDDYTPVLVSDCIIVDNLNGGILMDGHENVTVANCTVARNGDAGMWSYKSYPTIRHCLFAGNEGHGIRLTGGRIANCTIADNTRLGLWTDKATVTNSIVWGNGDQQVYCPQSEPAVTYSAIQGGLPGTGNLDADPCFAAPQSGDYHLRSQGGRWVSTDPTASSLDENWLRDDTTSPCIDAGAPADPIGAEPFPNGGRVNLGAYGGTAQASKSYFGATPCTTMIAGDINGDCRVDFADFQLLALHWLRDVRTDDADRSESGP